MAALAATAAITSCQQENLEPAGPETEGTVQVKVSIGTQTKGFTDLEGITWEVGDQIKYAGGVELVSEALTADDISTDGYSATFTFPASLNEVDRTGWFCSTKCHPGNYNEVEFTLGADNANVYTQDVAGKMNSRYLFLHSGTGIVPISKDVAPEIGMDIVGTIFRVIPYTTLYNDEQILSVKLSSNTKLVGTVAYDRGAGTYRGVNDVSWKAYDFIMVNLGTALSLEGVTSADESKGIYMAVAATTSSTPLNGYQYVIETNKATYIFDAMDKTLEVGENVVRNVLLNLDKATRVYEAGQLQYIGDLGAASSAALSAYGVTDFDGGYWYAQVLADGSSDWVNKDGSENLHFYNGVQFAVTDAETGEPVDWLTVKYGGNGGSHWLLTLAENTGAERSAVITAAFPDVKGYVVTEDCKTKSVTVTQAAAGGPKNVTYGSASLPSSITLESSAYTDYNAGYCLLVVEGAEYREWSGIYSDVTFKCVSEEDAAAGNYDNEVDWLSCRYAANDSGVYDCIWWVTADANESAEPRTAVVVAVFPESAEYSFPENRMLVVTQKAGVDNTIYDPASSSNMWLTKTVESMTYYYAPEWNKITDPEFTESGNNYNVSLPVATSEVWQAQVAFNTDMSTSADKTYDFYCILNSNIDHPGVTIKLTQTDNAEVYYFADRHPLTANTDYVYKMPNMSGKNIDKLSLFFDFGGNAAGTVVTIKDILFQEHQEY